MKRFFNWLLNRDTPKQAAPRAKSVRPGRPVARARPRQAVPRPQPEVVDVDDSFVGRIESRGPGKNVLVRNKFIREDTGTHETLTILDDASIDSGDEAGIDPYNTGQFDRSRNWDKRFRKD